MFKASFMNNSKWEKLLDNLTEEFDSIYIRYKLISEEKIKETIFDCIDSKPFFIEPVYYQEIQWIEIPKNSLLIQNKRITRQVITEFNQDLEKIENLINRIGLFEIEKGEESLKIYGYK